MKAVILAGGEGIRGKPFTDYFPKAMVPIEGKPLIDHIVQYLSSFGFIEEIIILADFKGLGGQIKSYFENRAIIHKKRLVFIQDSNSGTGGDLVHITNRLKKKSEFLLWFVDNLVAIDLTKMYKFYKKKKNLACIATRRYRKEETGYAIVKNGLVIEFKEKPLIKMQMAECLGVYILNTKIVKTIKSKKEKKKHVNLSFDVLQELSTKKMISAFDIGKTSWIDVDSPTKIERNHTLVKEIIKKMKH
ncbi:MAG: sugar phosphate nucleotidyltransferase [Nitrosopumilaceae archaeon]